MFILLKSEIKVIDKEIFDLIKRVYDTNKDKIDSNHILSGLTEELGEYSRAVRVEDNDPICYNKSIKESSQVEIIDLIIDAIEAYISRGGRYEDMKEIALNKLKKWENLWIDSERFY